MKKVTVLLFVCALAALPLWALRVLAAPAATRYVAVGGSDGANACTDVNNPCGSIVHAVQQTEAGDTVMIAAGFYTETQEINLFRHVTLRGAGLDQTIVSVPNDPNIWRVFLVYSGVTAEISHMTMRNADRHNIMNLGTLTLRHVAVTEGRGITGGGGIYNDGQLTVEDSYITNNRATTSAAAGLLNYGTAVIRRSAVMSNEAYEFSYGGGLHNQGQLTLENVTFAYNRAGAATAVSNSGGTITMTHVTIAANYNTFPGVTDAQAVINDGTITAVNTLIADNLSETGATTTQCSSNTSATITSLGHNLSSDHTCGFTQPSDQPGTDPQLGGLATVTGVPNWITAVEFSQSSPALDAADASACPATDARGIARPVGAGCDIGAYEFNNYRLFLPAVVTP